MNLAPVLKQRFFDANGLPLAAGKLYSYIAGTTTPLATYSNSTGSANANPVVLDSAGYADVWLDSSKSYKFILQDSASNVIYTEDNVAGAAAGGIPSWNTNTSYSQGSIVQDSSGNGLLYVSLTNSNQGNALTSVANWAAFDGNIRTITATGNALVTDNLIRSNSTSGSVIVTLPACSTTPVGKKITVKDVGDGTHSTSVKGSGSDQIDGAVTYSITLTRYDSGVFENNGTGWDAIVRPFRKAPTIQTFTSGSAATYTTPTSPSPLYLRVRMVGGGGGGAGSGTGTSAGTGAAGNATLFGSSLLTANGGSGGVRGGSDGGVGGTATIGAGASGTALTGGQGHGNGLYGTNTSLGPGGPGAASPFGGAGAGGSAGTDLGGAAAANTGSGGGGGGTTGAASTYSGTGGGAGGFIDAIVPSPAATYTYTVGTGGALGSAGTSGVSGGAGAAGYIEVTEYYQ